MKKKDEIKVCLVGSSGGHLTHLYMLKPFWKDKNRFWVTFDKEDARSLLEGEKVYPCYFPTNRSIKALIKNTKIAWDVLHKEKPDLIISCGAAVAVPFFYIGKMMGAKLVYIEVFDRIDKPTMTGKMVYKEVQESLKEGPVLFTGTPCQVGGLLKYLSTKHIDTTNLFTVDLICHGAPWSTQCTRKTYPKRYGLPCSAKKKQAMLSETMLRMAIFGTP